MRRPTTSRSRSVLAVRTRSNRNARHLRRLALLSAAAMSIGSSYAAFGQVNASWSFNGGGNWSDTGGWVGGVPANGGGVATFLSGVPTAPANISLDIGVTLQGL